MFHVSEWCRESYPRMFGVLAVDLCVKISCLFLLVIFWGHCTFRFNCIMFLGFYWGHWHVSLLFTLNRKYYSWHDTMQQIDRRPSAGAGLRGSGGIARQQRHDSMVQPDDIASCERLTISSTIWCEVRMTPDGFHSRLNEQCEKWEVPLRTGPSLHRFALFSAEKEKAPSAQAPVQEVSSVAAPVNMPCVWYPQSNVARENLWKFPPI